MSDFDIVLRAVSERHGVFLRRDALAVGVDDRRLRRGVRDGTWVRVRHGAYAMADEWRDLGPDARHCLLVRAVLRTMGTRVAASHHSACLLHGMDLWDVDLDVAHVTRTDGGAGRTERDVVHHEGLCLQDDLVPFDDHRLIRPVRAALESALLGDIERGLVVVDSGLRRRLFTPVELAAQHELMASWPGSRHLQVVTRLADGRSESVGESRSRFLFWSQGVPMPELQFEVRSQGRLVGVTDFAWPRHRLLGEFDGRLKYGRFLRPGEDAGDAVFREKRREDELRRVTGWAMVRLTWADLHRPGPTAATVRSMLSHAA
jgi:hypothetical protein